MNSRHPGPRRVWKVGSQQRCLAQFRGNLRDPRRSAGSADKILVFPGRFPSSLLTFSLTSRKSGFLTWGQTRARATFHFSFFLGSLWGLWAPFWSSLGCLWGLLGVLWAASGALWRPLGATLVSLCCTVGPLGHYVGELWQHLR